MTLEETKKVLAYVTAAYPRYYSNVSAEAAKRMATVWTDALSDYSANAVMAGVKGYISADMSGFPPAPGQIVSYIHLIGNPADRSGTEAWSLVRRAINVPWDQFEASFDTLPRVVQIAVGSPESLKELAQMNTERFETVAQSNFLRMYDAARKREATENRFSNSVNGIKGSVSEELQRRLEARKPSELTTKNVNRIAERKTLSERAEAPQDRLSELRARLGG